MSGITLAKTAAAAIPTPGTDKATVFLETTSGEPSYKDDAGTVTSLKGTDSTVPGPTGPAGTPAFPTTTFALGSLGATGTADFTNGPTQAGTLTANTAITLAWTGLAGTDDALMELLLTEDGTGGWTPTFAGVSWEGGVTPVPTDTTAGAILRYLFETPDGGTTVIGLLSGPGPTGATGAGVPTGGTTSQVLAKIDATDYNTHWVDPSAGSLPSYLETILTAGDVSVGSTTWTDVLSLALGAAPYYDVTASIELTSTSATAFWAMARLIDGSAALFGYGEQYVNNVDKSQRITLFGHVAGSQTIKLQCFEDGDGGKAKASSNNAYSGTGRPTKLTAVAVGS
jgi:hypothetical protein